MPTQIRYEGWSAGFLSTIASVLLFLGIVGLAAGIIMSVVVDDWSPLGFSAFWIAIGINSLFWGALHYVLFGALADIIGYLRVIAGNAGH